MHRLAALIGVLLLTALAGCASVGRSANGAGSCQEWPAFEAAARANAASLGTLAWSPYGTPETGWAVYAPLISAQLHSRCPAGSPGFAWALGRWQHFQGRPVTGVLDLASFTQMKTAWQDRRPFVRLRGQGVCPPAAADAELALARPEESMGDKPVWLTPETLAAYRAMVAAARREVFGLAADPLALRLFSGFRSPAYDAERCAADHNCDGVRRAVCSAHRTGHAFDIVLGPGPAAGVDSTSGENRARLTRTPAYVWLTANAWRFGFVNYTFEPWHWEWVGPAMLRSPPRGG